MTERRPGEWVTHDTIRTVYANWWLSLRIDAVERPDGSMVEHEVVRGRDAAGLVVLCPERGLLMIYRHRFMPDTWGWEIPGGTLEPGESPEVAALRECHEETGWRAEPPLTQLSRHHPSPGLLHQTVHVFLAERASFDGDPSDPNESTAIEWRAPEQVVADLRSGEISDGFSQLAVALAIGATGRGHLLSF